MKRMKPLAIVIAFILVAAIACKQKTSYSPKDYLTQREQDSILYKTIRYSAKLPPGATQQTKFDHAFDPYYKRAVADYRFLHLLKNEDGSLNFLRARPAKSISTAFEGIGGKLKMNESDSLIEYNEIFRMWKMPYNDVEERGRLLFDRMVTNRDLTLYYPKYTGDKYIEFPDGRFSFDVQSRMWVDSMPVDSLSIKK